MMSHLTRTAVLVIALRGVCAAQTVPSVVQSNGQYVMTIPYLDYGSGAAKQGYAIVLRSSNLTTWSLDSASAVGALAATTDSPTVASLNSGYRLAVPRLRYGSQYYAASFITTDLKTFAIDGPTVAEVTPPGSANGPTAVTIANLSPRAAGSATTYSSSKLSVSWRAPAGYAVDHYEILVSESVFGTNATVSAGGTESSTPITGLKSATTYSMTVRACGNAACTSSVASSPATGTTAEEYWQLQGTGNTVANLTKIVSDGNARISATRFGPEAGGVTGSRIQLYYGPSPQTTGNLQVLATAVTSQATDANVASSYLSFTSLSGTTGLISPTTTSTLVATVNTGQGVPLSAALGGRVRLFFEAGGRDTKTRIVFLDSQDGYAGRDFNSGSSGVCSTTTEYQVSGCVPGVAIGVEGDAVGANSRIGNARQFKVGYPTLNDWRWNGEIGTFMVFTTDALTGGCGPANPNGLHGYAVWTGSVWQVQYDASGCPKLFQNVQAMFPIHTGDTRYKMYYGDRTNTTGKVSSSTFPFLGPKRLIYADARSGGSLTAVDFEDWESTSAGRNVIFLWPNGDQLNDTAEGYIDDFHFLAPTGSLDLQVMYVAITDGAAAPIGAAAVLLNP